MNDTAPLSRGTVLFNASQTASTKPFSFILMTDYRTLITNLNIFGRCFYSSPKPFSVEFHSVLLSTGHLPAVRAEVWACLVSAMEFRV